jgi:hypothetical protein
MSDDLVKRLRKEEDSLYGTHPCGLLHEAADRIEALEAALRKVLNDIVRSDYPDQMAFDWLDEARALFEDTKENQS